MKSIKRNLGAEVEIEKKLEKWEQLMNTRKRRKQNEEMNNENGLDPAKIRLVIRETFTASLQVK